MRVNSSTPLVYAHRGASEKYAEHTRAAYLQALVENADGVECDVHLTADGHVVLLHDSDLDRTSTGTGPVAEKTLAELKELDFHSWKGAVIPAEYGAGSEQFLTLTDLLDILENAGREIGLAIEFKHPNPEGFALEEATLDLLRERGWDSETSLLGQIRVSFMSFDPQAVEDLSRLVPSVEICQLLDEVHVDEVAQDVPLGGLTAPAFALVLRGMVAKGEGHLDSGVAEIAGPGLRYLRNQTEQVSRWFEAGRTFRVWTVDDEADVDLCVDLGVQQITTNRPAEVRARIAELMSR